MLLRDDPVHAFVDYPAVEVPNAPSGPLSGATLAVKDLYDVAGYPTGGGHPLVRAESGVKSANAPAVQALLDAGARFVGKTHTDEMAYSLTGENFHYGSPTNPKAPGRITGGSSSGSAAAVAAGLADIALGSDTGGSVRTPASFCGVIGLRPTHGRIDISRVQPLAASLDTVGWFTREIDLFAKVGDVLLGADADGPPLRRMMTADDVHALLSGDDEDAVVRTAVSRVAEHLDPQGAVTLSEEGLFSWFMTFRTIQAYEAWQAHGAWIRDRQPLLGPGVRERFEWASRVTEDDIAAARERRSAIRTRMRGLLGEDGVLVVPTVPGPAPELGMQGEALESYRNRCLSMLCGAGLAGLPQLSMPLAEVAGLPLGVSLIGPPGRDRALIAIAERVMG
ncbi:amidase [Prosthecomicrobium pneumaticum]|uniref:Amidase n=1 Tax=Prosthecomicrobium pneumaticum TaxID=81895 RepID=A0A7W9CV81_9HYPH|nr:amidase [Prosthecomicrobium pneumaticum]MBB5752513.1 amidase [Prosthecomicrobium pneumaticum]